MILAKFYFFRMGFAQDLIACGPTINNVRDLFVVNPKKKKKIFLKENVMREGIGYDFY